MLLWSNHPLCSASLMTKTYFLKSAPFIVMACFHTWSSLRVCFPEKETETSLPVTQMVFFMHLHQLSLGGSMIGLWIVTEPQLTDGINYNSSKQMKTVKGL